MRGPDYNEVILDGQRAVSWAIIAIAVVALLIHLLATVHPEADPGNVRAGRICDSVYENGTGPHYRCWYPSTTTEAP